jgi:hypothetical protein
MLLGTPRVIAALTCLSLVRWLSIVSWRRLMAKKPAPKPGKKKPKGKK